jgi:hypothetical protein
MKLSYYDAPRRHKSEERTKTKNEEAPRNGGKKGQVAICEAGKPQDESHKFLLAKQIFHICVVLLV